MFEWLREEIANLRTRSFHVVAPPGEKERAMILESDAPFPRSYKLFVAEFGAAKLYRRDISRYMINFNPFPEEAVTEDGDKLWELCKTSRGLIYFRDTRLAEGHEISIQGWYGRGVRTIAPSFEQWLKSACNQSRRSFSRAEWQTILAGPKPFTKRDLSIVRARNRIKWEPIDIAGNGKIVFSIRNDSDQILPYLTLGVRRKSDKSELGGVFIPMSKIKPGEETIVEQDCYLEIYSPQEVEPCQFPEPTPETRDYYWEFKEVNR